MVPLPRCTLAHLDVARCLGLASRVWHTGRRAVQPVGHLGTAPRVFGIDVGPQDVSRSHPSLYPYPRQVAGVPRFSGSSLASFRHSVLFRAKRGGGRHPDPRPFLVPNPVSLSRAAGTTVGERARSPPVPGW